MKTVVEDNLAGASDLIQGVDGNLWTVEFNRGATGTLLRIN